MAFSGLCVGFWHRRIGFSIIIGLVHVDILGCLRIGWCWIFLIHLLRWDVVEFFLFVMDRRILTGDALLFDAGFGVGDFGGASPKILLRLLRNGISTCTYKIELAGMFRTKSAADADTYFLSFKNG